MKLLLSCAALAAGLILFLDPAHALEIRTGPEVGKPIPNFSLNDQNGRKQSPKSLMGKKGLVIVFHRSADW